MLLGIFHRPGEMKCRVSDLHLKNIGVTDQSDIVVLDWETWKLSTETTEKARVKKGITSFVEDIYSFFTYAVFAFSTGISICNIFVSVV